MNAVSDRRLRRREIPIFRCRRSDVRPLLDPYPKARGACGDKGPLTCTDYRV